MKKHLLLATMAAALAAVAAPAFAQTANLTLWTAAGDAQVSATTATLTTAAVESGETPLTANSALEYFDLEPALSLVGGTLPADTFEGSGLTQSFTAVAGTTITFSWTLSTVGFNAAQADRAFVVIDGTTIVPLGTVAANPVAGSFSYSFSTAGAHALAVLVMDVAAYDGVSQLSLSNVNVSAVPEPASVALLLVGLGLVGTAIRRRV